MKHFKEIVVVLLVLVVLLLGALVLISICDKNSYKKIDYQGDDMRDKYSKHEKRDCYNKRYHKGYVNDKPSHYNRGMNMDSDNMMKYDSAKAKQTMDLVERAVSDYNVNMEDTLSGIRNGTYVQGDLYVFAVRGEYNVGHPYRKDLENTKVTERKDVNGYYYGIDIASTTEDGKWIDYVFTVPKTNEQALKSTYCKKVQEHILCAGYYDTN